MPRFPSTLLAVLFALVTVSVGLPTRAGTFEVSSRAEMNELVFRIRAIQFLQRASFGPTDEDINALAGRMKQIGVKNAAKEWIDDQYEIPATSQYDTSVAMLTADGLDFDDIVPNPLRYRHHAWWHNAITAPDQLRQRVAWALSQIVVIGDTGTNFSAPDVGHDGLPLWAGMTSYYDRLVDAAGGNYRDLLGDVTFHPTMGVYLSHRGNRKGNPAAGVFPDENYAREIMQLFSIGLYELRINGQFRKTNAGELIPTYDNETIKSFARLFTGLNYSRTTNINQRRPSLHEPMRMFDSEHDFDPKLLLNGETITTTDGPGEGDGIDDINAGLDNLYAHPNVAPFISRLLIQRLVRSNPSRGYIQRVATVFNDNGSNVKGDIKAVVKAILTDREAWNSIRITKMNDPFRVSVVSRGTERNRLAEPVVLFAKFLRRYGSCDYPTGYFMYPHYLALNEFGQSPWQSPSVFNFYLPDFQPAGPISSFTPSRRIPNGSLFAPEFQIMTGVTANKTANRFRFLVYNEGGNYTLVNHPNLELRSRINCDFATEIDLASDPDALAGHLDLVLCGGTMTDEFRSELSAAMADQGDHQIRAHGAILSCLMSPDHMIVE